MKQKDKNLHGNLAKVDPQKDIESLYVTNQVTLSGLRGKKPPITNDEMVTDVRAFSEENKK